MMIGLILLAIVAVLIFFGVATSFFRKIGIPIWLAFLALVALVIGAVVPSIKIGSMFSMNVGGFILPLVVSVMLMFVIGANSSLAKTAIALIAVASVAVATRMLIMPRSSGMVILSSVIVGALSGIVAYLISGSRLGVLSSTMGGIVVGDVIVSLVYRFVTGTTGNVVALGSSGVFDSIIIAVVVGAFMLEIISVVKNMSDNNKKAKGTFNLESSEDQMFISDTSKAPDEDVDGFNDYFDDDV